MVTDESLRKFVTQCLILQSVNFPDVATTMELSWSKDIKPKLKESWFRAEMEDMLERVKFSLVSKLHSAALNGTLPGRIPPPAAHIKEMMKLIDSGALLGGKLEESEADEGLSPEEEEKHLTRLGIKNVTTKKKND